MRATPALAGSSRPALPRQREPWELCAQNDFAGIHVWVLDVERDATAKPVKNGAKVARCHVCNSRPDYGHEAVVVDTLIAEKQRAAEDARRAKDLRLAFGRRTAR